MTGPSPDPIARFVAWFDHAVAHGVAQPEAVALATATTEGVPSVRMVLYRGISAEAPRFFTNYDSRKGRELAANPAAAMTFHWEPLGQQVRFEGRVEKLGSEESDAYFHARPRGHQLNAWASHQSQVIASRDELEHAMARLEAGYAGRDVPRPPYWGGFRLVPRSIEFWTARPDRLHERALYVRDADGRWVTSILSP